MKISDLFLQLSIRRKLVKNQSRNGNTVIPSVYLKSQPKGLQDDKLNIYI